MKGTAPRASDPQALQASEKNRAENLMIVDLIRNDLGRLVPPGGVRVDALFEVEGFSSVWQMSSTVSAAPVDADLLGVFRALFPCGSVTGAPKIRAMEVIRQLERTPRGLYCGALGWLAPDGDFCFNVPIRTLEVAADGRARLGLGSGIVADSDPADEWGECLLKGRFLTELAPPFGLIETLRCEPDATEPFPLLELHLARLTASAARFGHRCEPAAIRAALRAHAGTRRGPHRVRLELAANGTLQLTSAPLEALPAGPLRLGLGRQRLSSGDPLLRHKTTARRLYDDTLRAAIAASCFDAVLLNERGEVADGARSSIFVEGEDGCLLTPPLVAGALAGVLRQSLIASGRAREGVLRPEDLMRAPRLYVGNALRGLQRAAFAADCVCG
jgi:para-aminobenzoate synthetase/4-amino-4-deoxychorismate lyase